MLPASRNKSRRRREPNEGVENRPTHSAPPDSDVCRIESMSQFLCAVLFVGLEVKLVLVQPLQCDLAVLGQVRSTDGCDCASKESWLPLFVRLLTLCCLLSLLLLDLGLECCGLVILSPDYGVGDTFPELERLVRELLLHGRDNLGNWEERIEVDDKMLLLQNC